MSLGKWWEKLSNRYTWLMPSALHEETQTYKKRERHRQISCMWGKSKHCPLKGSSKSRHHREKGSGNFSERKYLHVNYQVVAHCRKKECPESWQKHMRERQDGRKPKVQRSNQKFTAKSAPRCAPWATAHVEIRGRRATIQEKKLLSQTTC